MEMNAATMSTTSNVVVVEAVNVFPLFRVLERSDQQISTSPGLCVSTPIDSVPVQPGFLHSKQW